MTAKLLTETAVLQVRLEAARARERSARGAAARLKREMCAADRRLETQRLCILGRAWLTLGQRSPQFCESGSRFLESYITRDVDRVALRGTQWEVSGLSMIVSAEVGNV